MHVPSATHPRREAGGFLEGSFLQNNNSPKEPAPSFWRHSRGAADGAFLTASSTMTDEERVGDKHRQCERAGCERAGYLQSYAQECSRPSPQEPQLVHVPGPSPRPGDLQGDSWLGWVLSLRQWGWGSEGAGRDQGGCQGPSWDLGPVLAPGSAPLGLGKTQSPRWAPPTPAVSKRL